MQSFTLITYFIYVYKLLFLFLVNIKTQHQILQGWGSNPLKVFT